MLRKLLFFKFAPKNLDLGLLVIRILAGVSIFLKHGIEKVFHFNFMIGRLAGNGHYVAAVGVLPSLLFSTLTDGILTILLIFGLFTRWCALLIFVTLAAAWSLVLHFPYFTNAASTPMQITGATHGEMIVAYTASMLALIIGGGGKYSIDALIERKSGAKP
jgi:putative oxidoreductase